MDERTPESGIWSNATANHPERPAGRNPPLRRRTLDDLRPLVRHGQYRICPHAAKHAACEGFTENDIVGTILYGRELMRYWQDARLLVLGMIPASAEVQIPLHVVLEYARPRWVDVVTAFIPVNPHRVMSRSRLAELLRYDRHEPRSKVVGPGRGGKRSSGR